MNIPGTIILGVAMDCTGGGPVGVTDVKVLRVVDITGIALGALGKITGLATAGVGRGSTFCDVKVEMRCWVVLAGGGGTLGAAIKCVFGADSAENVVVEGVVTVSITLINIHALGPYVWAYKCNPKNTNKNKKY